MTSRPPSLGFVGLGVMGRPMAVAPRRRRPRDARSTTSRPACAAERRRDARRRARGAHAGRARRAQRHRRHDGAERRGRAVARRRRRRPAARPQAGRAAARHLVVGAVAHRGDRRDASPTPASRWSTRRSRAPSGAPRRPSSSSCAAARRPTSSACGRCSRSMGKAVFHLGPLGAGHAMKCLNNLVTAINFARRHRRPGDRQALRPRPGGDGRRPRPLDRHVVDLADAHPPARPQPQLRRSVQARADAEGHRHRDAARAQRRRAGAALGARTRSSGAPPAADAAPDASVSELARWVERLTDDRDHAGARAQGVAMRVLVTGAAGFIGRALVHALRVGHDVDRDRPRRRRHRRPRRTSTASSPTARSTASSISPRSSAAPPRPTSTPAGASTSTRRSACSIAAARRRARGGPVGALRPRELDRGLRHAAAGAHRRRHRAGAEPQLRHPQARRRAAHRRRDAGAASSTAGRCACSGVVVRPALPNGALSAFNSDVIREPLAGRDYECPVGADATIWVTSRRAAVANLLRLARASTAPRSARSAPSPRRRSRSRSPRSSPRSAASTPPRRRACATAPRRRSRRSSAAGRATASFARAEALGLVGEASIDALIRDHLETTA